MVPRRWLYWGTAATAMLAWLGWALAPRPLEVEWSRVTHGRFETAIEEDGKTRLIDSYTVSAPLAGTLQRISLREGDSVQQGDLLASITPAPAPLLDRRARREQQARLGAAQASLQAAGAAMERAATELRQSRQDLARLTQLAGSGFVAASQLEAGAATAQSASRAHDVALFQRQVAAQEVELAAAALALTDGPTPDRRMHFVLRAPVAGRVVRVIEPSEAAVAAGAPLLEMGDPARIEVVAELLSADAVHATPGRGVQIDRWGGPPLQGRVRKVEPAAFTKISALGVEEQRVRVIIDLLGPTASMHALGIAYRVNVRIQTTSMENVVKVPVSALFPVARPEQPWALPATGLYVVEAGRAIFRVVQLGARNDREAWVQGGLAPGTIVIIYPGVAVRDGARVRLRDVARRP